MFTLAVNVQFMGLGQIAQAQKIAQSQRAVKGPSLLVDAELDVLGSLPAKCDSASRSVKT